jgi:tetratricopeptide (TPR) repeat protein
VRRIAFLVLLFYCQPANMLFAQTTVIDSLRNVFSKAGNERDKLNAAVFMLDEYESLHTDTIAQYFNIAESLLKRSFSNETALKISITKIRLLRRQSKFEEAMTLCDSCLTVTASANYDPAIYRKLIAVKTAILVSQFKYKEALDICFGALKKAETEKDDISQIFCKITIGWINMEISKSNDALKWFFDAIAQSDKIGYSVKKGITYANISAVFAEIKKIDSAEFYIQKAFDAAMRHNNLTVQANCYYIFSDIMVEKGNVLEAEKAMNEGLKIRKKIGDPYFYVSDLYQLTINNHKKG